MTTVDISGLIFDLLALHRFLTLFNFEMQMSLSFDREELHKIKQVSSAKRQGLDKVALSRSFI